MQSREAVNKLLFVDIEVLTQEAKDPVGAEVVALKQVLADKISTEEAASFKRRRTDEVMALAEWCWDQGFKDSLVQVEFLHASFKVDCSKVYPEQEAHRSIQHGGQPTYLAAAE